MKALVYHGPDQRSWDSVPDPTIQEPSDIVVEVATTTICGSDLHIIKGDVPETTPGTVLGHEAIGRVLILITTPLVAPLVNEDHCSDVTSHRR